MKSERRHELQHNDLAEWTVRAYESVLPYRTSILGVTLLLVVGLVAWEIWHGHSESQAFDGWNAVEIPQAIYQFPAAQMPPPYADQQYAAMMEQASEKYAGTPAGDWARVLTADSCLFLGQYQLMGEKEKATNLMNIAVDRYEKSLAASLGPMAHERALFGKARVLESVGKLPEATAAYQDLLKEFPQGTYKAVADQRLEQLGKPDTAEFYKAVAEYKPKVKKEAEKSAAGPSGKAENLKLPENPDIPPFAPPSRPGESSSGTTASAPKTSGTATAPKAEIPSKPEPPKSTAALPTPAAPASSATPPAKK
jgi:hypothetical protein